MDRTDDAYRSVGQLCAALSAAQVSAAELTEAAIARIERYEPLLNAVCVRDFARARDAAREADRALARGERRPLLGVPLLVKESFNVAGLPTTWGFPQHRDFTAAQDALAVALAVARAKAAGAVVLGKTNVPLGLGDWQSYNEIHGTTNNPHDPARTPGGSSGGSAAALAAGYVPLALGSDIGGSLRVPAHFCGVHAHKPSLGIVPGRGHLPPRLPPLPDTPDLAVVGPMARCAADLELLLDVIAGPDEWDQGVAYRLELPPPRHRRLEQHRVLVLDSHPLVPTSDAVTQAVGALAEHLARAGVSLARRSELLPDLVETGRLYGRLLLSFLAANWPEALYADMQRKAAGLPAGDTTPEADSLRASVLSHRDWIAASQQRNRVRAQWRELFRAFDAVICPVSPGTAFAHDHSDMQARRIDIDGRSVPYGDQIAWSGLATLPGLPATAMPIGRSDQGLPIGIQIIGPWLEDRTPLRLAQLLEAEFGGFRAPSLQA
ncbi:amidase [Thiomonas sp. FB-6]|uniref:amidase n=1 Tax=Thiomonas sp. FB-6 TaxID=1158291 RepID=UPI000382C463|nr:amidase [Thiomonas sp. FB-6]